jgi:hypothetical protein
MNKYLPTRCTVQGGGSWLNLDYNNIDLDPPSFAQSGDGTWSVLGINKTLSLISPLLPETGKVTMPIGTGFTTEQAAKREFERLRTFVRFNRYTRKAEPGERMCSHTTFGGRVCAYVRDDERTENSCTNVATMTFLSMYSADDPDETHRRYACDDNYHQPQFYCDDVRLDGRTECDRCRFVFEGAACPEQKEHDAYNEKRRQDHDEYIASCRAGDVCNCGVGRQRHHVTGCTSPNYTPFEPLCARTSPDLPASRVTCPWAGSLASQCTVCLMQLYSGIDK